jgi:Tfp pilus assembly protein PilX
MKPLSRIHTHGDIRQRGVVLFIALIALVVMSLAAVALVRSVDTSTIIAGNLAFKQSATSSADGGFESAITWLAARSTPAIWTDAAHVLNVTNAGGGYYSNFDDAGLNITDETTWTAGSADGGTDATNNAIRYIIQRMCRNANQVVTTTNCMFGPSETGGGGSKKAEPPGNLGIASSGSPMYRITARVTGPRNTVSYIQAFVY